MNDDFTIVDGVLTKYTGPGGIVRVPDGVTEIGASAFEYREDVTRVILPDIVQKIGDRAFFGCTALMEIRLPKSLSRIGDVAFFGCKSLESIVLHSNLEEIGEHAFANCPKLNLSFEATKEEDWGCAVGAYVRNYNPLDEVILSCPICGSVNAEPLEFEKKDGWFEGATLIAYLCVSFHGELPEEGAIASATVDFPFCCKVGECFNAMFDYQHVITARLIRIIDTEISSAEVELEVLSVRNMLDFVKPLSRTELSALSSRDYDTSAYPPGDEGLKPIWRSMNDHCYLLSNWLYEDFNYQITIYTDEDGVDHLVRSLYTGYDDEWCFFGDKVLGFHEEIAPVNGLRIDWATDSVMDCVTDDKLVTIPDGVRKINQRAFEFKDIECLYIPESVQEVEEYAFYDCFNLKRIVLSHSVEKSVEEALRSQCPKAEIIREYKEYDKYEEYEEYENYWKSRQKRK